MKPIRILVAEATPYLLLLPGRILPVLLLAVILSWASCAPAQEAVAPGPMVTLSTMTPGMPATPTPEPGATSTTAGLEETRLAEQCPALDMLSYHNDVLGVALAYPAGYELLEDQYLSYEYGFTIAGGEEILFCG